MAILDPETNVKNIDGVICLDEFDTSTLDSPTPAANKIYFYAVDIGGVTTFKYKNSVGVESDIGGSSNWYVFKLGDESTDATTGVKTTWYAPAAGEISGVAAGSTTAVTGGALTLDIHLEGSTIFGTKITIDASESHTSTAATAAALTSDPVVFSAGDKIEFEIDSLTAGGAGLHADLLISWT